MHHNPNNQRGADQHHSQHWETGDGGQFPHIRCLLHGFTCRLNKRRSLKGKTAPYYYIMAESLIHCLTCVAWWGLWVLLAWWTRHTNIQIRVPKLWFAALTCTQKNIRDHLLVRPVYSLTHSLGKSESKPSGGLFVRHFHYLFNTNWAYEI